MKFRQFAKGRVKHISGAMNRLEEYALKLDYDLKHGTVKWFRFEGVTLKLAHDMRYTPDFAVMTSSGEIQFHEITAAKRSETTSGDIAYRPLFEDDAKVKVQVAASMFPLRFFVCYKTPAEGWITQEVKI